MSEDWRPIPSAPGYEASSQGRIRNARTGRVLRQTPTDRGYMKVSTGRRNRRYVHRLVCEAFHGAPALSTDHADHVDFDRTNNAPANLRWLAASLNSGRQIRRERGGWVVDDERDVPQDHVDLTEHEREAALAQLASQDGW